MEKIATKSINLNIEALRGFCALMVVFHHLTLSSDTFCQEFVMRTYTPPGHVMVMIFFVLSGYVIGLTNKKEAVFYPLKYFEKRTLRLYPIYLIALLISILVLKDRLWTIVGNLFFLQNLIVPTLKANPPLWSLNHEIIYYLLFMAFRSAKSDFRIIAVVVVLLPIVFRFILPLPAFLEAYLVGFSFWLVGLLVAWYVPDKNEPVSMNKMLCIFLVILGSDSLNSLVPLLKLDGLFPEKEMFDEGIVYVKDFVLLPVSLLSILIFSGKANKYHYFGIGVLYSLFFSHIAYLLFIQHASWQSLPKFSVALVSSSIVLLFIKFSSPIRLTFLEKLGGISYAFYVLHMPLIYLFGRWNIYNGSLTGYLVKLPFFFALLYCLSYFLEKKLQPLFMEAWNAKNR